MKPRVRVAVVVAAVFGLACGPNTASTGGAGGDGGSGGTGGTAGTGGGPIAVGDPCDVGADLCVAGAVCTIRIGLGTCEATCNSAAECATGQVCFELDFLYGSGQTERVCGAALGVAAACDPLAAYCDVGLRCLDGLDGRGAVCWAACDPLGDWSECGAEACVPDDYFTGELAAGEGVCLPYATGTTWCDPRWDICGDVLPGEPGRCADLDGDGIFQCVETCDPTLAGSDCSVVGDICRALGTINRGVDPRLSVCTTELGPLAPCHPDADRCAAPYQCAGTLLGGWRCAAPVAEPGAGYCTTDGAPCLLGVDSCATGNPATCQPGCPPRPGGGTLTAHHLPGYPRPYCLPWDPCEDIGTSCPAGETCGVSFGIEAFNGYLEVAPSCTPLGAAALNDSCDPAVRCAEGLLCIADSPGGQTGSCLQRCSTSFDVVGGPIYWPYCDTQPGGGTANCTDTACCIDLTCEMMGFDWQDSMVGVWLPGDSGCSLTAQDCAPGETCVPQAGAWARGVCVAEQGSVPAGGLCDAALGATGDCVAGAICAPFADGVRCLEVCDPGNAAASCVRGDWPTKANCFDMADVSPFGVVAAQAGVCLPVCLDDGGCDGGQHCLLQPSGFGQCLDRCDARAPACAQGMLCAPEPLAEFFQGGFTGSGTCDASAPAGADLCDVATAASDCPSQVCIEAGAFGSGFCARYDLGEITCDPQSGSGCRQGQVCASDAAGRPFCSWGATTFGTCNTANGDGDCTGGDVCVVSAGDFFMVGDGYCLPPCTFDAALFPGGDPGGAPCDPPFVCYHVPGRGVGVGFCALPVWVPGAPALHCDPLVQGDAWCGWRLGGPAACMPMAPNQHEPTAVPAGLCVARCQAGAQGGDASCGGDPAACAADPGSITPGLCLGSGWPPACDLIEQAGCDSFETCSVALVPPFPLGAVSACSAQIGTAPVGAPCDPNGELTLQCDLGLACVPLSTGEMRCVSFCDPAAPACAFGFACVDGSFNFFNSAGELGACLEDHGCDVTDAAACGAGETCTPVGPVALRAAIGHVTQCVATNGNGLLGELCTPAPGSINGGCREDLICPPSFAYAPGNAAPWAARCSQMCAPGATSCPGGAVCVDVSAAFNAPQFTYGICP